MAGDGHGGALLERNPLKGYKVPKIRIGAVRQLLWLDIDLEEQRIQWPAETEKTGYAHVTPMTAEALEALQFARSKNPSIGDAPVMPSPETPTERRSLYLARDGGTGGNTKPHPNR